MNKKIQIGIIFIILIGAVLGYLFINNKKVEKPVATIYRSGKLIKTIDLSNVKKDYQFKIGDDKHFNIIKVSNNGIMIVESNCPDKVCIKAGKIHDSVLPIACLPNDLLIKINGGEDDEFDTKTY